MSLPVFYLMTVLSQYGWVAPNPAEGPLRRVVPVALMMALWVATLLYAAAQGLMYGTRSAIFMDITNPRVAATQVTAYLALMNMAIAYSATWQGIAVEALGYPRTLLIDAITGLLCLAVLPFIKASATPEMQSQGDGGGARRARRLAALLAAGCVAFLVHHAGFWNAGAAAPMFETLFTLVFVASAVFLAAGAPVLGASAPTLGRLGLVMAPLLLGAQARLAWPVLKPEPLSGLGSVQAAA